MTDINLRSKDGFLTSRSVNTSNNSPDLNVFSNQSKKTTGKNSLSNEDNLSFNNTRKNISPSDPFSANNKILASINRNENISSIDFANRVMPPNILVESKGMTKNTSINNNIIQVNKKNIENNKLSRFDAQTVSLIKKFDDAPYAPYTKDYKCALNTAVITNTSEIKDYECSTLYEKTPFILAQDIFDLDAVKNDPELRTKISNFVSLLSTGDKAALAYTQNIFDRKPPLSTEKIKEIFDKLTSMMNTSYDPKVGNTKELVISALHDVSMPSDISQEGIGTCVGTSIQIQLAIRNPSEYLNMLDTLAQNKIYTSVTGANIPPNFTFTDEGIDKNLDTGRTISAKIMQNAIMDFSDMNTRDFNSAKGDGGLNYIQTVKGLKEIVNTNVETSYVWDYTPEQLINTLKNSKPDRSNPIEISMSYEPNGRDSIHSVNVINISDNQVTIVNPWGREETFPNDELNKRILSVSAPVNT
ncbi:MAG: hypothetical protein H7263_11495, partial [Candidatus Sericytochromatia bacterium]|nr:hypothetical protein [Candidatus Sericytochromatia bacterium]